MRGIVDFGIVRYWDFAIDGLMTNNKTFVGENI
jgi:hypothetical protein